MGVVEAWLDRRRTQLDSLEEWWRDEKIENAIERVKVSMSKS